MTEKNALYIHFPYCRHLCNYCDFYKKPLDSGVDFGLLESGIRRNFSDTASLCKQEGVEFSKVFDTVYLGGGTPSLWDVDGARFLSGFFKEHGLVLAGDCELTLEVDPGSWSEAGLEAWRAFGVNRFSLGIQSFDEDYISIMDRGHDLAEAKRTLTYFKKLNANFSVDLMLGLPYSDGQGKVGKRKILEELREILEFGPSHLSVYILKTRKNYPHNKALPDDEYISVEYMQVSDYLRSQGFEHYEVSNFSLPGRDSRHNRKYWNAQTVHALGANATGFIKVSDTRAIRYQHKASATGLSTEVLNADELKLEEVYLALRTNKGIELDGFFKDAQKRLEPLIGKWRALNYVESLKNGYLVLSPQGFLMIDSIMDDIFRNNLL